MKDANGKVVSEKNDLHWLDLPHKDYAIVVFAQTLEHLQHPLVAMRRIFAHMRPGGYLIANQPYHNRLHADPWHFSQLSGDALAALYELAGFEILEYSEWGTTEYLNINYVKSHWPNIDQCPADGGTFDSQGDSAAAVTNFLLRKPEARSRFRARSGASIPSATSFDPQIISGAGHTYAPVPAQVLLDMHAKFRVTQGVASGLLGVGYGRAASLALGSQAKLLSFARRHKLDSYPTPQVVAAVLFGAWAEKHAADRGGACKLLVLHGCDGVLYYTARHGGAESRASALTAIQRVAGSGSACPITEVRHALGAPPQAPATRGLAESSRGEGEVHRGARAECAGVHAPPRARPPPSLACVSAARLDLCVARLPRCAWRCGAVPDATHDRRWSSHDAYELRFRSARVRGVGKRGVRGGIN